MCLHNSLANIYFKESTVATAYGGWEGVWTGNRKKELSDWLKHSENSVRVIAIFIFKRRSQHKPINIWKCFFCEWHYVLSFRVFSILLIDLWYSFRQCKSQHPTQWPKSDLMAMIWINFDILKKLCDLILGLNTNEFYCKRKVPKD